jgi:hypothetical protein
MAEGKRQRRVRCQHQYIYDRLSAQKMSQVYRWLVPAGPGNEPAARLSIGAYEKNRSDLRPSLL